MLPLIFITAAALTAFSGQTISETPEEILEATSGRANPALWRTGDHDTTIYMLGTIHALPQEVAWETDLILDAFSEADLLITEANVDSDEAIAETSDVILQQGFYLDGTKLSDLYTDEERADINDALAEFGLSLDKLGNMKPWMAVMALSGVMSAKAGMDPDYGVDTIVEGWAEEDGIPLKHFETAKEQAMIFVAVPENEQRLFLTQTVDMEMSNAEIFFLKSVYYLVHYNLNKDWLFLHHFQHIEGMFVVL